ncbi:MAG TPA: hypothetical protein VJU83_07625 [Burkholderiales bacterium]|nr:hypothetical protein [Burkholderiales bacterium]
MNRRTFLGAAGAAFLVGCAPSKPLGVYETTEVGAPAWKTGQSWTYRRTDGFNNLPRGILTRSVTRAEPGRIELVTVNEHNAVLDHAVFTEPGIQVAGTLSEEGPVIGRIDPRWRRYDFPLVAGKRWSDNFYLHRTDNQGTRNYVQVTTRVEGWEEINVAGRPYRALILRRSWNLGPRSFFDGTLYREETEWYVPNLGATGRWETTEEYFRGRTPFGATMANGDRFLYVLESTTL